MTFNHKQCPKCKSVETVSCAHGGPWYDGERRCLTCGNNWDSYLAEDDYWEAESDRLEYNTYRE